MLEYMPYPELRSEHLDWKLERFSKLPTDAEVEAMSADAEEGHIPLFAVPEPRISALDKAEGQDEVPVAFSRVRDDLFELYAETDETIRPTDYAYLASWSLISSVRRALGEKFPYGYVMDDEGGIRFEWENGPRRVRLVIAAEPEGTQYIYHQDGKERKDRDILAVSSEALSDWLLWLVA